MSTRSNIVIDTSKGRAHIYCHYDGYPEHMLEVLPKVNLDELRNPKYRDIRSIEDDGSIEWYEDDPAEEIVYDNDVKSCSEGIDHTYFYDPESNEWREYT